MASVAGRSVVTTRGPTGATPLRAATRASAPVMVGCVTSPLARIQRQPWISSRGSPTTPSHALELCCRRRRRAGRTPRRSWAMPGTASGQRPRLPGRVVARHPAGAGRVPAPAHRPAAPRPAARPSARHWPSGTSSLREHRRPGGPTTRGSDRCRPRPSLGLAVAEPASSVQSSASVAPSSGSTSWYGWLAAACRRPAGRRRWRSRRPAARTARRGARRRPRSWSTPPPLDRSPARPRPRPRGDRPTRTWSCPGARPPASEAATTGRAGTDPSDRTTTVAAPEVVTTLDSRVEGVEPRRQREQVHRPPRVASAAR